MLIFAILINLLAMGVTSDQLSFDTIFEWNYINYTWPSEEALANAIENGQYIPQNNPLLGVKLWKDKIYLTTPRMKSGVPVTLAVIPATPIDGDTAPLLEPYPNWEMQTVGDCNAFQFVQSMEIDPWGRMWIIDTGRATDATVTCLPRLIILDLENNGEILRIYEFPESVTSKTSTVLNDLVLDHMDGGWAFITDSESSDPGIIVYSLKDNFSWKVRHESMKAQPDATNFTVAGTNMYSSGGVNGIVLPPSSGSSRLLYYSPLASFHLSSIPVSVLKNLSLETVENSVVDQGKKSSQTGGMITSNQGVLYFGLMNANSIAMWDTEDKSSFSNGYEIVFTDHTRSQWPDTFAIDIAGNLWYVSNKLQIFQIGTDVDITQPNYRLLKTTINAKNYQYLRDGTTPDRPDIPATSI